MYKKFEELKLGDELYSVAPREIKIFMNTVYGIRETKEGWTIDIGEQKDLSNVDKLLNQHKQWIGVNMTYYTTKEEALLHLIRNIKQKQKEHREAMYGHIESALELNDELEKCYKELHPEAKKMIEWDEHLLDLEKEKEIKVAQSGIPKKKDDGKS